MTNNHISRCDIRIAKAIFKKMHPNAEPVRFGTKWDFVAYGFRVKIKASSLSKITNDWRFNIQKNTDCDTFALMAFDDAKNHKLLHLWLVDAAIISHLSGMSISEGTLDEWEDVEVDLEGWTEPKGL